MILLHRVSLDSFKGFSIIGFPLYVNIIEIKTLWLIAFSTVCVCLCDRYHYLICLGLHIDILGSHQSFSCFCFCSCIISKFIYIESRLPVSILFFCNNLHYYILCTQHFYDILLKKFPLIIQLSFLCIYYPIQ